MSSSLIGIQVGGKYVVDSILGRGGMGCVALGHHIELGQKVAIKFMLAEVAKDASLVARFSREAQLAAKLQSDHGVRVFDVGRLEDGLPYLVMEYLEGSSLADLKDIPLETAVDYVLQAIEAIAEAHALGVVHRDLKPENLFLTRRPGRAPMVKVLDFGISKSVETEPSKNALTQTSSMLGSPMYMSPEQIRDSKTVDTRSDIWSLGVVLYELAEGRAPFDGASVGELLGRIQYEGPAPLIASPAPFAAVVLKCLTRSTADRYQTVAELARALRPFSSNKARIEEPDPDLAFRGTLASTRVEGRKPVPPSTTAAGVSTETRPERTSGLRSFFFACAVLALGGLVAGGFALRARGTVVETAPAVAAAPPQVEPLPPPRTVLVPVTVAEPSASVAPVALPRALPAKKAAPTPSAVAAPSLAEPDRGF